MSERSRTHSSASSSSLPEKWSKNESSNESGIENEHKTITDGKCGSPLHQHCQSSKKQSSDESRASAQADHSLPMGSHRERNLYRKDSTKFSFSNPQRRRLSYCYTSPIIIAIIFLANLESSITRPTRANAQQHYYGEAGNSAPESGANFATHNGPASAADPVSAATNNIGSAQSTCFGGLQTFEKISMSSFENPTNLNDASTDANGGLGSGILIQQDDQALTSECINLCRSQSNCLSFVIDYNKFECKSYATTQQELQQEFATRFQSSRATQSPNETSPTATTNYNNGTTTANNSDGYQQQASTNSLNLQQLLPSSSSNYFEKICLDGVANRNQFSDVCGAARLWIIERVVDSFLDGFVEKEVTNVNGKDECSKLCIFETQFVCRSADYDQQSRLCRLSKEDRRTQPQAMRHVPNSQRQYLENQCATPGPSSCVYETRKNVGIISMDALKFAQTAQDCQMKCNQETTFNCRSYSFHQQRCFLSGDDSFSLNSNLIRLPAKQGWTFGEKKCLVELCSKGIFSYEKITGFTLRSALSTSIDLMASPSMIRMGLDEHVPGGQQAAGFMMQPEESSLSIRTQLSRDTPSQDGGMSNSRYGGNFQNQNRSSSIVSTMMNMMMGQQTNPDPMQESDSSAHTRRSRSSSSLSNNLAITEHCRHSCDLGYLNCPAFTIDYRNNRCQRLDRNSQGRHHELVARDGFAYYEKICLRVPEIMSMCQDKYWIFERVIGYELAPRLYEKSLKFVQSRRDCEEYCLEERQFQCRSALYNDETSDCKLSRLDRRLAILEGAYYRNFNSRISYLENNCIRDHDSSRQQCSYEQVKEEPSYPTFTELIETVPPHLQQQHNQTQHQFNSNLLSASYANLPLQDSRANAGQEHQQSRGASNRTHKAFGSGYCEQLCNDNAKFECHSFGYYASTGQCFLSGDDSISAGELAASPSAGFSYFEKKCRPSQHSNRTPITTADEDRNPSSSPPSLLTTPSSEPSPQAGNPYLQPAANRPAPMAPPQRPSPPTTVSGFIPSTTVPTPIGGPPSPIFVPSSMPESSTPNTFGHGPMDQHQGGHPSAQGSTNVSGQNSFETGDSYKCGLGHTFVYQRIPGFEPIGGYLTLLLKDNEQPGIVAECSHMCRRTLECRAFVVDYGNNQCFAMLENSSVGLLSLRQTLGKDYFEGFCLANHLLLSGHNDCRSKTWIVDKIVDQAVIGVQHQKLITDSNRVQCREACLEERLFWCKSAMFDSSNGDCKLYSIDRESVPQMRLLFTKGVDFFENQCQISSNTCPYDPIERDMTIITTTKSIQALSTFDCELACNMEASFNCRSYTYMEKYPTLPNLCLLSSDSRSTSQRGSVREQTKTLYAERNCYYRRPRIPNTPGNQPTASQQYQPVGAGGQPAPFEPYARSPNGANYPPGSANGAPQTTLTNRPPSAPNQASSVPIFDPYAADQLPLSKPPVSEIDDSLVQMGPEGAMGAPLTPALGQAACKPHQYTFERTFGYDFKLAPKERAPIAPTIGIAIGCQQECLKRGDRCQAFVIEYALPYQSCFLLGSQLGANKKLLIRSPNSAYFEKVCLPRTGLQSYENSLLAEVASPHQRLTHSPINTGGPTGAPMEADDHHRNPHQAPDLISPSYSHEPWSPQLPYYLHQQQQLQHNYPSRSCTKLWSFERFVNYNFSAPADKVLENCLSRDQCETFCINEASFSCRSATYDYNEKLCRLFKSTRRTMLSHFIDLEQANNKSDQNDPRLGPLGSSDSHPGTAQVLSPSHEDSVSASSSDSIQTSATSGLPNTSSVGSDGGRRPLGAGSQASARQLSNANAPPAQQQQINAEPTNSGGHNIDYMENTCTPEPSSCQYRQIYDQFSPFIDKVIHASSLADCQRQCDQERLFTCKSVNFDPSSRNCMLVNEDLISLNRLASANSIANTMGQQQKDSLLPKRNTIYSEKGNCEMISVQCNSKEMLVLVNFDSPFRGRIMAKGNPEQCFLLGDGQTSLQFPIVFGPKCNSRQEGHNTFVNEVLIQQHPVIMTESDKTVRVMCAFEAPEQTITLKGSGSRDNKTGIDVAVGIPDSNGRRRQDKQQFSSIISNKAAPPSVVLRILDQAGRDASMINLGDDLTLRIQMQMEGQHSSALGIFARNLAARSSSGESLLLIDNEGCPVDHQVFPALEVDPKDGRSLFANFKAFRFPSSGLVNFEVQIRFCPERCQPVECGSTASGHSQPRLRSYGRRKRRRRDLQAQREVDQQPATNGPFESEAYLEPKLQEHMAVIQSIDQQESEQHRQQQQQGQTFTHQQNQPTSTSSQLRPSAGFSNPLDSLSTVMKPGKAFEYVRKLLLVPQHQNDTSSAQGSRVDIISSNAPPSNENINPPAQPEPESPAAGSPPGGQKNFPEDFENVNQAIPRDQVSQDYASTSQETIPSRSTSTTQSSTLSDLSDQMSTTGDSLQTPSATMGPQIQMEHRAQGSPLMPTFNDREEDQMSPQTSPKSTGSILMHVDEKVMPSIEPVSTPVSLLTQRGPEFSHQAAPPYGRFSLPEMDQLPLRGQQPSGPGAEEVQNQHQDLSFKPGAHLPDDVTFEQANGHHPLANRNVQNQAKEMPLRFSILVNENSASMNQANGQAGDFSFRPISVPNLIVSSNSSVDMDHVVIAGKRAAQEESVDRHPERGSSSLSPSIAASVSISDQTEASRAKVGSYEQTFDAMSSNSINSAVKVSGADSLRLPEGKTNSDQLDERPGLTTESAAASSNDCQLEAGRSRLRAIIWTGTVVIVLNVSLVLLSLVIYFRRIHSRHELHTIASSASDCGAQFSTTGTGSAFRTSTAGDGSRWPSVVLKSKNNLNGGGTSLNAHEHFFCKLNSKQPLDDSFNWPPNLSSRSSHSTISSLASGLCSSSATNIRVNHMRPLLRSAPFDAHSSLRSKNFDSMGEASHAGQLYRQSDSDDAKKCFRNVHQAAQQQQTDKFNARYTKNIDMDDLHTEGF